MSSDTEESATVTGNSAGRAVVAMTKSGRRGILTDGQRAKLAGDDPDCERGDTSWRVAKSRAGKQLQRFIDDDLDVLLEFEEFRDRLEVVCERVDAYEDGESE